MSKWFGRKDKPEVDTFREPNGPLIAAILLRGPGFPYDSFAKLLSGEKILGQRLTITSAKKDTYTLSLNEGFGGFIEIPKPYGWKDLEGPCATAWMWPPGTPAETVKDHQAFILMTIMKDRMGAIERRLLLTQVLGIAARHECVMGVYWPEGTLVHYPPLFSDFAAKMTKPEAPPLYLWIDYRVYANDDGTYGMFTTGMPGLGLMEIEVPRVDMPPGELREWGLNLTAYQLENGPVLKDGDTIGPTAEPEFCIHYRPSRHGHPGMILAIEK